MSFPSNKILWQPKSISSLYFLYLLDTLIRCLLLHFLSDPLHKQAFYILSLDHCVPSLLTDQLLFGLFLEQERKLGSNFFVMIVRLPNLGFWDVFVIIYSLEFLKVLLVSLPMYCLWLQKQNERNNTEHKNYMWSSADYGHTNCKHIIVYNTEIISVTLCILIAPHTRQLYCTIDNIQI